VLSTSQALAGVSIGIEISSTGTTGSFAISHSTGSAVRDGSGTVSTRSLTIGNGEFTSSTFCTVTRRSTGVTVGHGLTTSLAGRTVSTGELSSGARGTLGG
jgi:hypothetical protein